MVLSCNFWQVTPAAARVQQQLLAATWDVALLITKVLSWVATSSPDFVVPLSKEELDSPWEIFWLHFQSWNGLSKSHLWHSNTDKIGKLKYIYRMAGNFFGV